LNIKRKRLAIIGECMIEFSTRDYESLVQGYGGDSINTAVYFSRMAGGFADVSYVTVLGEDNLSDAMEAEWREEGVDVKWVCRSTTRQPGAYLIQLDKHGERSFLYWRNDSAARYLFQHPQMPEIESALEPYDMLFFSGISIAILPKKDRVKLLAMIKRLSDLGVKLAFDTNYRPVLWESPAVARKTYKEIFALVDLVFTSDVDEAELWADKNTTDALQRLHYAGAKEVVLKQGELGCQYSAVGKTPRQFPATQISEVIDTTSAGDAFNAGFLARYLDGASIEEACQLANLIAGIVIQSSGAIIPASQMKQFSTIGKFRSGVNEDEA